MIAVALGWMIGTGIAMLALGIASPFTGITLMVFGVLGFLELLTR